MVRLIFLFLIHIPSVLYAQINWGDYSQSFEKGTLDKPQTIGLILAIPRANNSFWSVPSESTLFKDFRKDTSFKHPGSADMLARTTFDTARAQFFLHGVGKNNAALFQFRVREYPSHKVITAWKPITQFTDSSVIKSAGLPQMAYLGGYKTSLGNMLILDVKEIGTQSIIATSMVAWESIKPAVSSIYTSEDLDVFLQKLQYPWAKSTSAIPSRYSLKNLRLPATNSNLIFALNADIYEKNQVQYQLIRNDRVTRPWHNNEYDNSFIWLKDLSPGKYRILIRYAVQPQHIAEYPFEVEPFWYQSFWFRLVVVGLVATILGLALFIDLLIKQRRKTSREIVKKQRLQLELKALYAQLNPHFIFNALSSIQGLINQQDIQGANTYLSDFARLMRESLDSGSKEETPLQKELQTMDTYLKLEQLRFGFRYNIHVDKQIDRYATSLPSLLWQPLLENAVKHGVSHLQQAGQIAVRFEKTDNTLIIKVTDNGKGGVMHESKNGFGLKLTRDRIRLLNELNNEQPISLEFNERLTSGLEVTLTFNHWFS